MKTIQDPRISHDSCHGTLRERLMSHLVQLVPEHSAICEFNCGRTRCSESEWTNCQRRIDSLTKDEPV